MYFKLFESSARGRGDEVLTNSILNPLMLTGEWDLFDYKKADFCDEENLFSPL